jgi:hypothetical protein
MQYYAQAQEDRIMIEKYLRDMPLERRVYFECGAFGVCQTSCPVYSCSVCNFKIAVFGFRVKPYWSSRLPISGFS